MIEEKKKLEVKNWTEDYADYVLQKEQEERDRFDRSILPQRGGNNPIYRGNGHISNHRGGSGRGQYGGGDYRSQRGGGRGGGGYRGDRDGGSGYRGDRDSGRSYQSRNHYNNHQDDMPPPRYNDRR